MKVLKLILWTILHAFAAWCNFFVFAFLSAMVLGEAPVWVAVFDIFLSLGAFAFLTVLRIKILFPKQKNPDAPIVALPPTITAPPKTDEELIVESENLVVDVTPTAIKPFQPVVTPKRFCQHCGAPLDIDCVVCSSCGKQVAPLKFEAATPAQAKRPLNKWVAFLLCLFLGEFGFHKFYEGKVFLGIVYLFTWGLFCVGAAVDLIVILTRPNPYYR